MDAQWQTGHGYKVNGGNRDTKSQVYDLKIHNIKKSTSHLNAKPQTSLKESCPIFNDSHAKVLRIQELRELLWLALQAQGSELDPQNYHWEEEWTCAFVNSAGKGKTEGPWGLLASQPTLLDKFQFSERPFQAKEKWEVYKNT